MRILVIGFLNPYTTKGGGVETYTRKVSEYLKRKGALVTAAYATFRRDVEKYSGAYEIYIPPVIHKMGLSKFYYNIVIYLLVRKHIDDFDIVHINGDNGVFVPFIRNIGTIMTLHGSTLESLRSQTFGFKPKSILRCVLAIFNGFLENLACKRSDRVISVSKSTQEYFERATGRNDIITIPPCIDIPKNAEKKVIDYIEAMKDSGKFLVLWTGIDPIRKGLPLAKESVKNFDNVILFTVGYADPIPSKNVINLGYVQRDVLEYLQEICDIFLFPTKYEGLGIVVLEAMSHGLVPVASSIPPMKEIIDEGVNGFLANTQEEFESKIAYLKTHREILPKLKANARQKSLQFDCNTLLDEVYKVFSSLEQCNPTKSVQD